MSATTQSSSSDSVDCPICDFVAESITKLKTHILLKHSDLHLCLFCIEKKGWSDEFASEGSYNEHYWAKHKGTIKTKEEKQREEKEKRKDDKKRMREEKVKRTEEMKKLAKDKSSKSKKSKSELICHICTTNLMFENGADYDRHFLANHCYDYCKECHLIGPISLVRFHILTNHPDSLCYICCGSSPTFTSGIDNHLANKHGLKTIPSDNPDRDFIVTDFRCFDCCSNMAFSTSSELATHIQEFHPKDENLRGMILRKSRNMPRRRSSSNNEDEDSRNGLLRRICGIKNESGKDCFSISALHLLAQTDISERLVVRAHHSICPSPSCLLAHFLNDYSMKRIVSSKPLVNHYSKFGLINLPPIDVGDFLRGFLKVVCQDSPEHGTGKEDLAPLFKLELEWKFECPNCRRFSVVSMSDFVLKIAGSKEGSFEKLLNTFLHEKKCWCSHVCQVYPGVRCVGKYIFIEIDRAVDNGNISDEVKDLALYPLELDFQYNMFGYNYSLLGTISYKLDSDEGGHYITTLFPNKDVLTKIHETEIRRSKRYPDFDAHIVIIALQKIEMVVSDLRRIELEIEFKPVMQNLVNYLGYQNQEQKSNQSVSSNQSAEQTELWSSRSSDNFEEFPNHSANQTEVLSNHSGDHTEVLSNHSADQFEVLSNDPTQNSKQ